MKQKQLLDHFIPKTYEIQTLGEGEFAIRIKGHRVGRPSKRLTFHQSGLKIKSAKILQRSKNKEIEYAVDRINHIPAFQEVRLHTAQVQYPGDYELELNFVGKPIPEGQIIDKSASLDLRQHFPSIDEAGAKSDIEISFN